MNSEYYKRIHELFGAPEKSLFLFTSSGEEAISHVILGTYFQTTRKTGKTHFITTRVEEAAILKALQHLENVGCFSTMLEVNAQGQLTEEVLNQSITPRTALVSFSCANGLTGCVQPISQLLDVCRRKGVLIHLDVTHVMGRLSFNLKDLDCDFISFDGASFGAPAGTGGLFIKNSNDLSPLIFGGSEQHALRAGKVNTQLLHEFTLSLEKAFSSIETFGIEQVLLLDRFEEEISKKFPEAHILMKECERLPSFSVIAFPGIHSETLTHFLPSARSGGGSFQKLSCLLKAMQVDSKTAESAVHFSLQGIKTLEPLLDQIKSSIQKLSKVALP